MLKRTVPEWEKSSPRGARSARITRNRLKFNSPLQTLCTAKHNKGNGSCGSSSTWNNRERSEWEGGGGGRREFDTKRFSHCNFIFSQLHLKAKRIKNFRQIYRRWKLRRDGDGNGGALLEFSTRIFPPFVSTCWLRKWRRESARWRTIMKLWYKFSHCIFRAINFSLPLLAFFCRELNNFNWQKVFPAAKFH